jgi:phage tail protein X
MDVVTLASIIALAGCGRLGFEDRGAPPWDGPLPDDPDHLTLVVTSDEYGGDAIGTPIPGATVLVDRGSGLERSVTDGQGTARFPIAGLVACHVVFKGDLGWRVYTLVAPRSGTIELGSRPQISANLRMTFPVPLDSLAGDFTVRIPEHCGSAAYYGTPPVSIDYDRACEGKPERVIAFARSPSGSGSPDRYLDGGDVMLANGSMHPVAGSYQPLDAHQVHLGNLPGGATSVTTEILARSGLELTPLEPSFNGATPQGGAATLATPAAPGGNALRVLAFGSPPPAYLGSSERITPVTVAAAMEVDAQGMLPLFDALVASRPPSLAWTGGGTGGTIIAIEANAGMVQWDAYLDPSATGVMFPDIPADLAVPIPKAFDYASVVKLDVPGATTAGLARTIDRRWLLWPHDDELFPPDGSAITRILYTAALGPPFTGSSVGAGASRPALPDRARAAAAGSPARARPGVRGGE